MMLMLSTILTMTVVTYYYYTHYTYRSYYYTQCSNNVLDTNGFYGVVFFVFSQGKITFSTRNAILRNYTVHENAHALSEVNCSQ